MWLDIILFILTWIFVRNFTTKNKEEELVKEEQNTKKIFIEKINEQYYAWDVGDKEEFIVQSKELKSLIEHVVVKFKTNDIEIKTTKEIECHLKELKFVKI
jgi:hypothetical protein